MTEIDVKKLEEEEELIRDIEEPVIPSEKFRNKKQVQDEKEKQVEDVIKLQNTIISSKRTIITVKSVFPFDFFPDQIVVDENKINIIKSEFFFSKEVYSIPIENMNGVTSSSNLFFGQLRLEAWGISKLPDPVEYLWKKDAVKVRRIISGLITAHHANIDMTNIPLMKARRALEEIGRAQEQYRKINSS